MLNSASTYKEVKAVFEAEQQKARYWFVKQHHGEDAYTKWRTRLCAQLYNPLRPYEPHVISDPVFYNPPSGNRWMIYERAFRDGKGGAFSNGYSVCFFETVESIGAYIPVQSSKGKPGCMYYTPHFFRRLRERLELSNDDNIDLMMKFVSLHHSECIQRLKDTPKRQNQIALYYPGSFGFGTYLSYKDFEMITVRTFLPRTMLSPQRLAHLKAAGMITEDDLQEMDRINLGNQYK